MRILAALLVIGCGGGEKRATTARGPEANCAAVGDRVAKFWADEETAARSDVEKNHAKAMAPIASERIIGHCTADRWSADAVTCVLRTMEAKRIAAEAEKSKPPRDPSKPPAPEPPDPIAGCLTKDQYAKLQGSAPTIEATTEQIDAQPR
jgi:hypothetical protein